MTAPILRVDLAPAARDFRFTATEPGLAMLDAQGTNYAIMHRWLGDLAAEPEHQGTSVAFFLRDESRGRLENVEAVPATRAELQETLKPQLDEIAARLKKVRPNGSTEESLHRVARQTFIGLTADLTQSDFDSYFFKVRAPGREPWRLVWCWGYQRTDQQPAPAYICTDPDCLHLFVRRAAPKAKCPVCDVLAAPRRNRGALAGGMRRWLAPALVALLLLLGAFLWFNRPRLVVVPGHWTGPQGSQVRFQVLDKRWGFFEDDVTQSVLAHLSDPSIIAFDQSGSVGLAARRPGDALVTFVFGDRSTSIPVQVGPPVNPEALTVTPDAFEITVGATAPLVVEGAYADGAVNDLTAAATFDPVDASVASVHGGRVEGLAAGETEIAVRYQAPGSRAAAVEKSFKVVVREATYESLEIEVHPLPLALGQSGQLEVFGLDANGKRHELTQSSLLRLSVTDAAAETDAAVKRANIEGDRLFALRPGEVTLIAKMGKLSAELPVTISDNLAGHALQVRPQTLRLRLGEWGKLSVVSSSDEPIELASSDEEIVWSGNDVFRLSALAVGKAEVTITQGNETRTVQVEVVDAKYASVRIEPRPIRVSVGDATALDVLGTTVEGDEVTLAPEVLSWLRQPLTEYASLNRDTLEIVGFRPTEGEQSVAVQYGDDFNLIADAPYVVLGGASAELADVGEFLMHPPVGLPGRTVVRGPIDLGAGFGGGILTSDDGLLVRSVDDGTVFARAGIPAGATVLGADGFLFNGVSDVELRDYLRLNPLGEDSRLLVRFPDGTERVVELGKIGRVLVEVNVEQVIPRNVTAEKFDVELNLTVRRAGEYRVLSAAGEPLTEFQTFPADSAVKLLAPNVVRSATGDDYALIVERRIGESLRRYPVDFVLESQ